MSEKEPNMTGILGYIKPLSDDKVNHYQPPKAIKPRQQQHDDEISIPPISSADNIKITKKVLSKNLQRQFQQGKLQIEDCMDLHGLTVAQAKPLFNDFISESIAANFFVVAIIHGKGKNQFEQPILKNCVNQWCHQHPQIIAAVSATKHDGGNGKVYIMLEKRK